MRETKNQLGVAEINYYNRPLSKRELQRPRRHHRRIIAAAGFLALALPGHSQGDAKDTYPVTGPQGQPEKIYGVMYDGHNMTQVAQSGFNVVKKTILLTPTNNHLANLSSGDLNQLSIDMNNAKAQGIKVIFELWPRANGDTMDPLRPSQQRNLCDVGADLVSQYPETLGVEIEPEPNNPHFVQPQLGPDGSNVSAAAYESWQAHCYDQIKAADPNALVIGGSLASHGNDDPSKGRGASTSPVRFIQKLCTAYQASGRQAPIMDDFDQHSYQANSSQPPGTTHPNPSTTITIADYGKLESTLDCFDFPGSDQPIPAILWGESGYESKITPPDVSPVELGLYNHQENASALPVDETTQGNYYAQEIDMAACQPDTIGEIQLSLTDDQDLRRWQSGVRYPDGTPKKSMQIVAQAIKTAESPSGVGC